MVSLSIRPSLISSLVLMFLLFAASSNASNKVVDVNAICKPTENPSLCSNILNSKPGGAKGADLVSLALYTVDVARGNITNTINLIKSLIAKSAHNPNAKNHYEMCLLHFDYDEGALAIIDGIKKILKSRDYNSLNIAASAVQTEVSNCIVGDSPSDPPYHDSSLLPRYADVVDQVVDIILSISYYLVN
ncbi:hypothetical protein RIF29_05829 [Crotalaria pallida]|uniref:Pectinesterase inhibitor domain-containing protein n=1 Tax=Crotalaria pallida TaxID=3830 RepID=A0AAN9J389_CROPI